MRLRRQLGVLAYEFHRDQIWIVLVTNRKGTRWIFPKGQPEASLSDKKVAMMEAFEEAGILGNIDKDIAPVEGEVQTNRGKVRLIVYPMHIRKLVGKYPESKFRKRLLIDSKKALRKLDRKPLKTCIKKLVKKLKKRHRKNNNA
ncbi:MAG: NUDIX hydrolase [Gammaproteobacteria bacterium]|nr:NUDIX hydrolase [Gammaproteobacteria bacterium]